MCDIRTDPFAGVFASDEDKHFEQAGVDHGTGEHIAAEIFLLDLHHQCKQLVVDIGCGVIGDMNDRGNAGENSLYFGNILKHGKISLKDQPLTFTGIHAVQDTGIDKEEISLPQMISLIFTCDIVDVLDRHNDLDWRMPVRGISLLFMIVK